MLVICDVTDCKLFIDNCHRTSCVRNADKHSIEASERSDFIGWLSFLECTRHTKFYHMRLFEKKNYIRLDEQLNFKKYSNNYCKKVHIKFKRAWIMLCRWHFTQLSQCLNVPPDL